MLTSEACKAALLVGGLYLIIRKIISWRIPVSFIGTVAVLTLIFGHEGYDNVSWMIYNLLSGALTVLIRYFGSYPEGVTYAILIMNICTWAIDKAFRRRQFGVSKEDVAAQKAAAKAAKEAAK